MSDSTVNKLKKMLLLAPQSITINADAIQEPSEDRKQKRNGGPESARLITEINKCGFYYVNGIATPYPIGSSTLPTPVLVATVPASKTTELLIEATLIAANSYTNPETRFLEFFPPPVPPPQFLQRDFVKYKINYEPVYIVPPCVGSRRINQ
jgi:hypothetical protein